MSKSHTAVVRRRAQVALRLLTIGGLAAMLAGCYDHETRVAGFGPWFSGALLLSLYHAAWILSKRMETLRKPE